jgi:hypothetical protein
MSNGYDQQFLKICQGGETIGLLCVNIDHTNQSDFRAYIKHISVIDISKFTDVLPIVLDYIWQSMYADTIRINLHHFKPENDDSVTMAADMEIKTALGMQKKGFKWKTLINDSSGTRYQIMQINKPKDQV